MRISIAGMRKVLAGHLNSMAVLSLLLVFALNSDTAHSHDGEPGEHFECEICLKFGQDDDFTQSRESDSNPLPADKNYTRASLTPQSVEVPTARSRSPPRG